MSLYTLALPSRQHAQTTSRQVTEEPSYGGARGPVAIPSREAAAGRIETVAPPTYGGNDQGPVVLPERPDGQAVVTIDVPLPNVQEYEGSSANPDNYVFGTDARGIGTGVMSPNDDTEQLCHYGWTGPVDRGAGNGLAPNALPGVPAPVLLKYLRWGAYRRTFGAGAQRYPAEGDRLEGYSRQTAARPGLQRRLQRYQASPKMESMYAPLLTRFRRPRPYSATTPTIEPPWESRFGAY